MSFALWCVVIAAVLPYFTVGVAKAKGDGYDNADPRRWLERLDGLARRADHAHRNHFESFPLFAAAVLLAQIRDLDPLRLNLLAGVFIGARLIYTALYLLNLPTLRSIVWFIGLVSALSIFISAGLAAPIAFR